MISVILVSYALSEVRGGLEDVRGPGGRICWRPPAWKAATGLRANALFTDCLAAGFEMIGKAEEVLVVNARLEAAAARADCLSMDGRMIEAIVDIPDSVKLRNRERGRV